MELFTCPRNCIYINLVKCIEGGYFLEKRTFLFLYFLDMLTYKYILRRSKKFHVQQWHAWLFSMLLVHVVLCCEFSKLFAFKWFWFNLWHCLVILYFELFFQILIDIHLIRTFSLLSECSLIGKHINKDSSKMLLFALNWYKYTTFSPLRCNC